MKKADWNTYENELEKTIDEILTMDPRKKDLGIYFERFRNKNGIFHYKELDAVVFERMYGRMPEKSEALKIRYWRCGQHLPKNREELLRLGAALEIGEPEMDRMLKELLLEQGIDTSNSPNEFLAILSRRYLTFISESRRAELGLKGHSMEYYLRHILYTEVMDCLWNQDTESGLYHKRHDYSINFGSECARFFKDSEKISRSTLQRLFMVMLMPEINTAVMNHCLDYLNYAPLSGDIRSKSGACPDRLYLWLLEQFERYRTEELDMDLENQKQMLKYADKKVTQRLRGLESMGDSAEKKSMRKKLQDLRIMKFRSFGKE